MKVLRKSKMPNGTDIQIEDWKKSYSSVNTLSIGAYPIAKNSSMPWIKSGNSFRLSLDKEFTSDKEVFEIFNDLEQGKVTLEDLSKHFHNGKTDEYHIGMIYEID